MLLGEVRDDIDNLNGRPNSTRRCLAAVDVFRQQPTEANRTAVREAYAAIPKHLRRYALGDMDRKDFPLRVIVTGPGNQIELWNGNTVDVTAEIEARWPGEVAVRERDKYFYRFPGGESYADADDRARRALVGVARTGTRRPLLVAHEMVGRTLLR